MPLLTRMVATPLAIDIGPGAVQALAPLLADTADLERRPRRGGGRAGPGRGARRHAAAAARERGVLHGRGRDARGRARPRRALRAGSFDALVGIGGGRTLDVAKYAATLTGLPLVAVATNLAHDGIASPVSSLVHDGHKGSYGVQMPMAIVVDLDYVRRSEPRMRRSGIGDAISNLSAIADWRLAERGARRARRRRRGRRSRTPRPPRSLHREDGIDDDPFLVALAEALVLSGLAMATAGSSRPCSGGEHEILHAIDALFPELDANHGELAGAASALHRLPARQRGAGGADRRAASTRHGLPRCRKDLGLDEEQFAQAVVRAPSTRPDRYTILEHLDLDEQGVRSRIDAYLDGLRSLSCGRPPNRLRSSSATAASTGPAGSTSGASRRTRPACSCGSGCRPTLSPGCSSSRA